MAIIGSQGYFIGNTCTPEYKHIVHTYVYWIYWYISNGAMATTTVTPAWLVAQMQKNNDNLRIFDTTITVTGLADEAFKR